MYEHKDRKYTLGSTKLKLLLKKIYMSVLVHTS